MGKPKAPPAPDYKGAAEATAKSQQTSQYTPYGAQVYSGDSSSPSGYRSTISLDPRVQQTLDTQMNLSNQMGDLTQGQIPGINEQYSQPMDLSSVPQIADQAYSTMTSRLDPRFAREEDQLRTRLHNQGLVAGGEAFNNEMQNFSQGKNDAYQQANLGAIQTMPQTYQLATSARNQPLNEFNAIRTGAQVQNPQFQSQGPGANYLGAAGLQGQAGQQQFGTQTAQYNAMLNGLFGLGGAGIMAL